MTENEEEVSPEQTDLIVQYSSVTGHDDLDQCANHLKAHNWDLAAAINTNMATRAELESSTSSHSMPPTSSSSAGSLGSLFGPAEPTPPPPAGEGVRRRFTGQPAVHGQVLIRKTHLW